MFQPVIPVTGLAGWRFLQETYNTQFDAFTKSIELKLDTDYFQEKIGTITTAEGLVSDRRLLSVALGAFGLQDDINNRYFIQKVLDEGTTNDDSLANRFSDPRYREMSEAFGFGPDEYLKAGEPEFTAAIISRFQANSFEVAAGEQDASMRVALYAQRELGQLAGEDSATDTKWFTVLGDPPLRKLFEKALGLPESIGQIDIDQQLSTFKDRARSIFGSDSFDQFLTEDARQDVLTKFILRDQIDSVGAGLSAGSIALTLLQS
jgi:hypothetical protein